MQKTGIEYLTHTWNPIAMRCTRVSDGCLNCWHLRTADRLCCNNGIPFLDERRALAGDGQFIMRDRELSAPLRAKKPAVIGVQFMGDLFHEAVPDEFIGQTYQAIVDTKYHHSHTFLILSKRPHRMLDVIRRLEGGPLCSYMDGDESGAEWVTNPIEKVLPMVWHGLTVCNQQEADEKRVFINIPGNLFLSLEPMLSEIDITPYLRCDLCGYSQQDQLVHFDHKLCPGKIPQVKAVILGGETGPGARPLHPDWVRSVRDQCAAAGVPFFFKGWGEYGYSKIEDDLSFAGGRAYDSPAGGRRAVVLRMPSRKAFQPGQYKNMEPGDKTIGGTIMLDIDTVAVRVGKKKAGRLLDGRTHDDLPWLKP